MVTFARRLHASRSNGLVSTRRTRSVSTCSSAAEATSGATSPRSSRRRNAAAHSRWKWSGTTTSAASATCAARPPPRAVHSTISTAAEASSTTTDTGRGSDVAGVTGLSQMLGHRSAQSAYFGTSRCLHPRSRVELHRLLVGLWQHHDALGQLTEIHCGHVLSLVARRLSHRA